jgi:hypothetical protein
MKLNAPISTAIAIGVGLVVLLGYFFNLEPLVRIRQILLNWAVILAAVALLVGVTNLLSVHWKKVAAGKTPAYYFSLVLIVSLILTIAVVGYFGPTAPASMWIFNYIQVPIESSLFAILTVTLVVAIVGLMRRRQNSFSIIFLATVLIVLLGTAPILGVGIPGLYGPLGLRSWIARIPAVAGSRGILLGVALGTIATGLRVLMGADRPYGGQS